MRQPEKFWLTNQSGTSLGKSCGGLVDRVEVVPTSRVAAINLNSDILSKRKAVWLSPGLRTRKSEVVLHIDGNRVDQDLSKRWAGITAALIRQNLPHGEASGCRSFVVIRELARFVGAKSPHDNPLGVNWNCRCLVAEDVVYAVRSRAISSSPRSRISTSRIMYFCTFPVTVIGNSVTKRMNSGILKWAMRP